MEDVTHFIARYREAARHLWNAFLRDGADWDRHSDFEVLCDQLFTIIVLTPIGRGHVALGKVWDRLDAPVPFLKVIPKTEHGVPISINRTHSAHGYWDDPVNLVKPGEVDLRFAGFFDWDELGWREFEFCRVVIAGFSSQPHLVGRLALISPQHAGVFFDSAVAVTSPFDPP
jgi:hypothetical protein